MFNSRLGLFKCMTQIKWCHIRRWCSKTTPKEPSPITSLLLIKWIRIKEHLLIKTKQQEIQYSKFKLMKSVEKCSNFTKQNFLSWILKEQREHKWIKIMRIKLIKDISWPKMRLSWEICRRGKWWTRNLVDFRKNSCNQLFGKGNNTCNQ